MFENLPSGMKRIVLFLFYILLANRTFSQEQQCSISGKIVDISSGQPCAFCNVALLRDSAGVKEILIGGVVADSLGCYKISMPKGEYFLRYLCMGYETVTKKMMISSSQNNINISLKPADIKLDEVEIKAEFIHRDKKDHFTVDIARNPFVRNDMMLDALSKIPGMHELSIYGRNISTIYVNGRRIDGVSLKDYMEGLPAEMVESIEVYPYSSPRFGNGTSPVIRIKMKKMPKGQYLGNTSPLLMASRKGVNQLSAATTLSTNFGKFSTFTYVRPAYNFYGNDRSSNDLLTETRYLDSEETFKSRENNYWTGRTPHVEFDQNFFYALTDQSRINLNVTSNIIPGGKQINWNKTTKSQIGREVYDSKSDYEVKWRQYTYNIFSSYDWDFDKKGSNLMFSMNYIINRNIQSDNNEINYDWLVALPEDTLKTESYLKDGREKNLTWSPAADLYWVISQVSSLSVGAKYIGTTQRNKEHHLTAKNDLPFVENAEMAAYYKYNESYVQAYATFNSAIGQKIGYYVGLRYYHNYSSFADRLRDKTVSRTYNQVYPSIGLFYDFKKDYQLSVFFNSNARLNSAKDLYTRYSYQRDKEIYVQGEEDNKTPRQYMLDIAQSLTNHFNIEMGVYQYTNIQALSTELRNDTVFYRTKQNGNRTHFYIGGSWNQRWKNVFVKLQSYLRDDYRRKTLDEPYQHEIWNGTTAFVQWTVPNKKWILTTSWAYNSPHMVGISHYSGYVRWTGTVRYNINDNLYLSLNSSGNIPLGSVTVEHDNYWKRQQRLHSNQFNFRFNYRFHSKSKNKVVERRAFKNQDALERNK